MNPSLRIPAIAVSLVLMASGFFCFGKRMELIDHDERVSVAQGNLSASFQRRFDLTPQLIGVVQAAAKHETDAILAVTESREQLLAVHADGSRRAASGDPAEGMRALNELRTATRSMLSITLEAYPELRATESFLTLQKQIEGSENRINVALRDLNEATGSLNALVRKWGGLPLCSIVQAAEMFTVNESTRAVRIGCVVRESPCRCRAPNGQARSRPRAPGRRNTRPSHTIT